VDAEEETPPSMSCKNESVSTSTYDHGLLDDVEEAEEDAVDEPPLLLPVEE